jgi:hypothetical protein
LKDGKSKKPKKVKGRGGKMARVWGCFVALVLGQGEAGQVVVHTVEGSLPVAPLVSVAEDWTVRLGGEKARTVAGKEVVSLRHASSPLPGWAERNFLLLTNGDRFPLDGKSSWRLEQDRLFFRPGAPVESQDELSLSVNYVSLLWLETAEALHDPELFLVRLQGEKRMRDAVLLRNGDRVEGTLKAVSKGEVRLEVDGQEKQVPVDQVMGIAFNTELQARLKSKGLHGQVVLAGGGRFGVTQVRVEEGKKVLTGKTLFGARVQVPLEKVRGLDVRQGPAVYLADLQPHSYEHTPFLGVAWPLVKDKSVTGRPLRLGANTHDKGLGMHSQSKVTYTLAGNYRWFETVVGLDEQAGQLGRVRLKVLVDGKEKENILRTGRDGPLTLRVEVSQARELSLVVEFAEYGDVQGQVNWGDARLIR